MPHIYSDLSWLHHPCAHLVFIIFICNALPLSFNQYYPPFTYYIQYDIVFCSNVPVDNPFRIGPIEAHLTLESFQTLTLITLKSPQLLIEWLFFTFKPSPFYTLAMWN